MPLASVCGRAATWSSFRMGEDGTPAFSSRASSSSVASVRVTAASVSKSPARWVTRAGFDA
jgi:hypothetical protein